MQRIFGHWVASPLVLLAAIEVSVVFGSAFAGLGLPLLGMAAVRPAWGDATPAALVLACVVAAMTHVAGLYDLRHESGWRELFIRLAMAFLAAYLVMAVLGYLLRPLALGRIAYVLSAAVAFPVVFLARLSHYHLTAGSRRRQLVLLLGCGRATELVLEAIDHARHSYEVLGYLEAPGDAGGEPHGLRCLGTIEELDWISRVARPDVIVVNVDERRGTLRVSEIVECKLRGISVDDWPGFYEKLTGKIPVADLRPSWLLFADGFKPARLTLAVKRALDLVVSLTACLVSLPLMIAIAVAIRLDSPGSILFRQERLGRSGRTLTVYKFRSMLAGAHLLPVPPAGQPDPRVTRVGRLLRRTRLDELPQLFNVLLGQMSLVGPRPEWVALVPEFTEKVPFYLHRLAAKPGMTGWAQVRNPYGATVANTLEKLQYDLYYIKNMSLFLDLLILLHTIQIVLFTRGSEQWTNRAPRESTTSVSYAA
jgi:sugar transferase (PEP-CTERM system associated)